MRDLNGDQRFDINPALVINSPWSSWIDYKWQYLSYDYLELLKSQLARANPQVMNLPEAMRRLKSTETYSSFRQKIRQGQAVELGNGIINSGTLTVSPAIDQRRFVCRIYELSGANGMNVYNITKTDATIIDEHVEKLNFNGKAWLEGMSLSDLDQLPSSITSFEPIYDIKWYSDNKDGVPVFGIKLKLELTLEGK